MTTSETAPDAPRDLTVTVSLTGVKPGNGWWDGTKVVPDMGASRPEEGK